MTPSGNRPTILRGWKDIAQALGVSERKAKELGARSREPLPVRRDHVGIYAVESRLRDWVDAEDMAYKVHLALHRGKRVEEAGEREEPAAQAQEHAAA